MQIVAFTHRLAVDHDDRQFPIVHRQFDQGVDVDDLPLDQR